MIPMRQPCFCLGEYEFLKHLYYVFAVWWATYHATRHIMQIRHILQCRARVFIRVQLMPLKQVQLSQNKSMLIQKKKVSEMEQGYVQLETYSKHVPNRIYVYISMYTHIYI